MKRRSTISLDGFEEAHNWMRGNKNSFKNAVRAIELLSKTKDLRYDVVTCINQNNFNDLNRFYHFLLEKGLKEWCIFAIFPDGRAKQHNELQLPSGEFKELFDFIKKVRREGKIKLNFGCKGILGNYEGDARDSFFFCRAGINVASVLVDGSISACPSLRANFIQGNIYKEILKISGSQNIRNIAIEAGQKQEFAQIAHSSNTAKEMDCISTT